MARSGKRKVFVAMSGGVDSSVAAGLLLEAGYDVHGLTMVLHSGTSDGSITTAIESAQQAAKAFQIPHQVLDLVEPFNELVLSDFTTEYLQGRTPNPCVCCNRYLKFGALFEQAMALGGDFLATGHYARIVPSEQSGRFELRKGKDPRRDQSYFLYGIRPEILPRLLFPLGELTKAQVRQIARKYNLAAVERPESQDICFVNDRQYQQFIQDRAGAGAFIPGPFKDEAGKVLGQHRGIGYYTIGQRERLGLSLGRPVYVYHIDAAAHTVYVGPEEKLFSPGLLAGHFNALVPEFKSGTFDQQHDLRSGTALVRSLDHGQVVNSRGSFAATMRIRYHAPEVPGQVTVQDGGRIQAFFAQPQKAVTPGQSVVFYQEDVVIGGAVIERAIS